VRSGAGFAAVPFIKSWSPSARARFAGAPVTQDLSALAEGQQMVINWRGQPIFIAKRSKAMLDVMKSLDSLLA
jgi:ubiquinol-cytochrome c reductase iron-sulfur subunit